MLFGSFFRTGKSSEAVSSKDRLTIKPRPKRTRQLQVEALESRIALNATTVIKADCDLPYGNYTALQEKKLCPRDTAIVAQTASAAAASTPTIVLDFKEERQGVTSDIFGNRTGTFNVTRFGFLGANFDTVAQAVLAVVRQDYYDHGPRTSSDDGLTATTELKIDFVIGNIGQPPSNGAEEYYYIQIGDNADPGGPLGVAGLSVVRTSTGLDGAAQVGDVVGTIFTNNISGLSGLQPPNALVSGNLGFTSNAIGGTTSHEIGHTVSLSHISHVYVRTQNSKPPVMGTGAVGLPNQARINDREFEILGYNPEEGFRYQLHLLQLSTALGVRAKATTSLVLLSVGRNEAISAATTSQLANSQPANSRLANSQLANSQSAGQAARKLRSASALAANKTVPTRTLSSLAHSNPRSELLEATSVLKGT